MALLSKLPAEVKFPQKVCFFNILTLMLVLRYSRKFFAYFFLTAAFLDSVYAGDPSPSEPSVVKPKPPVVQPDVKPEPPFVKGEELEYKVYYSFIHAGTATMSVDEDLHNVGDHLCYKIKVRGESSKALGLLGFKVDDRWETYLDAGCSNPLRPHRCITHLQENGYERKEKVDFDYQLNKAKIEVAESSRNMETEVTYHPIPHAKIKDLIGGYYDLRSIDTTKLKPGDKLTVTVLHDQQLYENVDIEFLGTKTLTMKLGKTSALVFAPLVPIEGTIFSGERPVKTYISNDVNKVPLKLEVNLFIGGVEIELTDYKGLKEPIHFQPS